MWVRPLLAGVAGLVIGVSLGLNSENISRELEARKAIASEVAEVNYHPPTEEMYKESNYIIAGILGIGGFALFGAMGYKHNK